MDFIEKKISILLRNPLGWLDYRINKDWQFRNPLKEIFPSGFPIEEREIKAFHKKKYEMMIWMNEDAPYSKRLEDITGDVLQKIRSINVFHLSHFATDCLVFPLF